MVNLHSRFLADAARHKQFGQAVPGSHGGSGVARFSPALPEHPRAA